MKAKLNTTRINSLLADKQDADQMMKATLKINALYSEKIASRDENSLFSERTIAIADSDSPEAKQLLDCARAVELANKALVDYAPEFFDSNSIFFKEPKIVTNITRLSVTINSAVTSKKVKGSEFAERLNAFIRSRERDLLSLDATSPKAHDRIIYLNAQISHAKKELVFFTRNFDTEFRRRGQAQRDLLALYSQYTRFKEKGTGRVERAHVHGGGLILIKHKSCLSKNINLKTRPDEWYSIYDHLKSFTSVLYPYSKIFSEDEVNKLRMERATMAYYS